MKELYVSPSGDDAWPGTREQPLATLTRARDLARGTGAVVNLLAGTHRLAETFHLTEADSGVTYRAEGEAVVSGGRRITGWRERDGVWLAEVGDLDTRRLHVDGRRAERSAIDTVPGNATRTDTGYVTDSTAPQSWGNPGDVEFVLRGVYPWTEARLGVAAVEGDEHSTTITMAQPAFGWAIKLYNSVVPWEGGGESYGPGLPTRVENGVGFLTEPGTFALDRSRPGHHVLRYRPRPGEDPGRTEVVAPALEELVKVTGARDVAFLGITFADATWMRPSSPEGFLHYHGTGYYDGGPIEKISFAEGAWVTVPGESLTIPANVVFEGTERVTVEGCRFTGLGATALCFSGGTGILVRGNVFEDVCGGGVSIGESRGARIENNWIHDIGLEYSGSPGIAVTASEDSTLAHNQVNDVPHCGIVLGPGKSTRVLRNLTFNTLKVLADGGGVYLSGPQGDSHDNGAVIRGNVVRDTLTPYNFALYTDYGAAWVTVEGNAVQRADNTATLQVWPPLENVVLRGNIWDADPVGLDDPPEGVTLEDNVTPADEKDFEARAAAITARAGLEPGYAHLLGR
ncbi:right-handed parallel beta-helix repeat-containing protein [Streptosporangium sp. NBC_01495]|uniref:right-handed parallel beta-helix repeat-containing protein n=1 Tax=Streptosporangium sp. NBC_01495 TaxID=2903899 RepID=UPI002E37AA98|nr:right-handed parallel beta-helix repeat-containing protein [Streptosporangium sp. NBC_01495]